MKTLRIALALSLVAVSLVCLPSCKRKNAQAKETIVQDVQNTVDGMAGGAAFRAGEKAKQRIPQINDKHNQELDKALEE